MGKVLRFRERRNSDTTAYVLALSARWERTSKTKPWLQRSAHPENLGNLLQCLAQRQPAIVFVIENLVADILDKLGNGKRLGS